MKSKNPLYVVTQDNVVEEVSSYWEVVLKKLNLTPFLNALRELIEFIWMQIDSYPMVLAAKSFIDKILNLFGLISKSGEMATA